MTETESLAFYREAYEKSHARAEALEKSNTRLYEQEALHTESYGIVCAERDRAVNALSEETLKREKVEQDLGDHKAYIGGLREACESLRNDKARATADYYEVCARLSSSVEYAGQLQADALKVVEGFDEGAFCRDVAHDAESGWAMKLLPYMVALGRLTANVRNPPVVGAALSMNTTTSCSDDAAENSRVATANTLAERGTIYESVGFQYRFPTGTMGAYVWRDSPEPYNGNDCHAAREIFAIVQEGTCVNGVGNPLTGEKESEMLATVRELLTFLRKAAGGRGSPIELKASDEVFAAALASRLEAAEKAVGVRP